MEVKPGYQQTDVGVIPIDWHALELNRVCSMKSGEGITAARIDQFSQYPCYGGNGLRGYTSRFTHDGTFALVGRQGALCGNVVRAEGKFFASEHAVVATARAGTDIDFLTYALGEMRLNRYSESSAQPGLSVSKVLKLPLAVPPTETEQRAIATALRDVDALVDGLHRLIAKKRDLKLAVMQQLLSGQIRLPGFQGDWEVKRLGELLDYEQPTKYLVRSTEYSDANDVPVLTAGKTFVLGYTNEDDGVFSNLPVIIFDDFTTASKFVSFPFKVKSSAMKLLRTRDPSVNLRLVYELMQLVEFPVSEHKRYWISEYQELEVRIPGENEQTAIMKVLSDMDAELAALEARRDKTRDLKEAMMQELLTGKTRLVPTGGRNA